MTESNEYAETDICSEIAAARSKRILQKGHAFGLKLPEERDLPLVPFLRDPPLICEIKRRSPSCGDINNAADPEEQAERYREQGVVSVSVLTEEDYFSGSLRDLRRVKQAFPRLSVLRKDFLLDYTDIQISYRAGADAILLIASLHSTSTLEALYSCAKTLGLAVLMEVHSTEDVEKIRSFQPDIVGINCRNLKTFQTDRLHPLILRHAITWPAQLVYESGIQTREDAYFAYESGFDALLCGEAVMRTPSLASGFIQAAAGTGTSLRKKRFWTQTAETIYRRRIQAGKKHPLVKICGICSVKDAVAAAEAGADILGFVFAESPRRAPDTLPEELRELDMLKVAVVTGTENNALDSLVAEKLAAGSIDAVQFHGNETPEACAAFSSWYKAVRPRTAFENVTQFRSPRILIDAWHEKHAGGSGRRVKDDILEQWKETLWLAGGITGTNVGEILHRWNPELIDVSSGLEEAPGKKSGARMRSFFHELKRSSEQ